VSHVGSGYQNTFTASLGYMCRLLCLQVKLTTPLKSMSLHDNSVQEVLVYSENISFQSPII